MAEYVDLGMKTPCGDWNDYQSRIEAQTELMHDPLHLSVQEFCDVFGFARAGMEKLILKRRLDVFALNGQTRILLESAKTFAADLKAKQSAAR